MRRKLEPPFWIGMGLILCFLAWKTKLGAFHNPGPGFVAFFTGLFFVGVGIVMAFSEAFSKTPHDPSLDLRSAFRGISWFRLSYAMALLLLYGFVLNMLGYILTTFLMMWGLFYDWERKNWFPSFLASFITTGVTYLTFEVGLHCQLPRGIFPWW